MIHLTRRDGLDFLRHEQHQQAYPGTVGSTVNGVAHGGRFAADGVDISHLRNGHIDFDPGCTTCLSMQLRERQHRRLTEEDTAGAGGEVCMDLAGPLPEAWNGDRWLFA